jgi:hypothetical protein
MNYASCLCFISAALWPFFFACLSEAAPFPSVSQATGSRHSSGLYADAGSLGRASLLAQANQVTWICRQWGSNPFTAALVLANGNIELWPLDSINCSKAAEVLNRGRHACILVGSAISTASLVSPNQKVLLQNIANVECLRAKEALDAGKPVCIRYAPAPQRGVVLLGGNGEFVATQLEDVECLNMMQSL